MKNKSLFVMVTLAALMGVSHAEGDKKEKKHGGPTQEQLDKYDKDKDGKLSKDEKAEMKKDKQAGAAKKAGGKKKKKEGN